MSRVSPRRASIRLLAPVHPDPAPPTAGRASIGLVDRHACDRVNGPRVSCEPATLPRELRGRTAPVRVLHLDGDDARALANSTQRAVARARRKVIDTEGRVLQSRRTFAEVRTGQAGRSPRTPYRLAELLTRVHFIHERLLIYSARVELEIDRLDVTCTEICRLTGSLRAP